MQPEQPVTPGQPSPQPTEPPKATSVSEQNRYDFIMNPEHQHAVAQGEDDGAKKKRIIIVGAVGAVLLLLMTLLLPMIFKEEINEQVAGLAKQHSELLRIAEIGEKKARGTEARNLATTSKVTLQATLAQITAISNKQRKISSSELRSGNAKTDQTLTEADQANNFDRVFIDTMQTYLRTYLRELQTAHSSLTSTKDKQSMEDAYNRIQALVPEQATQTN